MALSRYDIMMQNKGKSPQQAPAPPPPRSYANALPQNPTQPSVYHLFNQPRDTNNAPSPFNKPSSGNTLSGQPRDFTGAPKAPTMANLSKSPPIEVAPDDPILQNPNSEIIGNGPHGGVLVQQKDTAPALGSNMGTTVGAGLGATGLAYSVYDGMSGSSAPVATPAATSATTTAATPAAGNVPSTPYMVAGTTEPVGASYLGGDTVGAGLGANTTAAAPGTLDTLGLGGSAADVAGVLGPAAAVGAYYGPSYYKYYSDLIKNGTDTSQDSATKAALLSNLYTAWSVPLLDAAGIPLGGSNKGPDQIGRDQIRSQLLEHGVIDPNYNLDVGGNKYQIGVEDPNADGSHPYDVNFSKSGADQIVGSVDPLASIVTGGDEKLRSDFSGYFSNAIMNGSGDQLDNARSLYAKAGVDRDQARQLIQQQSDEGKIDPSRRDAYFASIDRVFGVPGQETKTESSSGGGGGGGKHPKPPTATPAISDLLPGPGPAPVMPEPDDEPSQAEQDAVNNYQQMLARRVAQAMQRPGAMYGR